jgi:hypothetical protein
MATEVKPISAMPVLPAHVVVTDIQVPFGSMVVLILKWMFAAIPALLVFMIIGFMFSAVLAGLFAALTGTLR